MMNQWHTIVGMEDVSLIEKQSFQKPQVIFKHSTRCGISIEALEKVNSGMEILLPLADMHYLDLLTYRPVSQYVSEKFGVLHQSPQVIIIVNGLQIYTASHAAIHPEKIREKLSQ